MKTYTFMLLSKAAQRFKKSACKPYRMVNGRIKFTRSR